MTPTTTRPARRPRVLLPALVAILGSCNSSSGPAAVPGPPALWPSITHKAGAYFICTPADAQAAKAQGLTLSVLGDFQMTATLRQSYTQLGMQYIDTYAWGQLQQYCSGTSQATIEAAIQTRLTSLNDDPLIAGWLLVDDYPGCDIRSLMNDVHQLVQSLNATAPFARPTLCDFGGWMDNKSSPTSTVWQTHYDTWDEALTNFSPIACDAVFLYPEGMNTPSNYNNPTTIDWSMKSLLPYVLDALKTRGWDPRRQPLIGGPPVYNWTQAYWQSTGAALWKPLARAEDIATQVAAFCQAGAISINPYAWNDPYHAARDKYELFNYEPFLTGFKTGVNQCHIYWGIPWSSRGAEGREVVDEPQRPLRPEEAVRAHPPPGSFERAVILQR